MVASFLLVACMGFVDVVRLEAASFDFTLRKKENVKITRRFSLLTSLLALHFTLGCVLATLERFVVLLLPASAMLVGFRHNALFRPVP